MGLLSTPAFRQKLAALLNTHSNKLCALSYIVGLGWFLCLVHPDLNHGTYMSENALSPGLVEHRFHHDHGSGDFYRELKQLLNKSKNSKEEFMQTGHQPSPVEWLQSKFLELGLDVYDQNFTVQYPAGMLGGKSLSGRNVFGILRAHRSSSTEALVISAPFRSPFIPRDKSLAGIALMLGLARNFQKQTYWAKDIIFLVTEREYMGMQAWLEAYHDVKSDYISSDELSGRAGSIQAALNLEIPGDLLSRMNVKMEGVNGQLTNLDFVNTAVKMCNKERIPPLLQKQADHDYLRAFDGVLRSLSTLLRMMFRQASNSPTGNQALFQRYHIEAVTLQGIKLKSDSRTFKLENVGRVVEGIFRSLNNLNERFHQSFFFYLLPCTNRYISIGVYMPPFGLIAAPVLIKALALWVSLRGREEDEEDQKASNQKESHDKSHGDAPVGNDEPRINVEKTRISAAPLRPDFLSSVLPAVILAFFIGLISYSSPAMFVSLGRVIDLWPGKAMFYGLLALQLVAACSPHMMNKDFDFDPGSDSYVLLKSLSLLALALLLGATAMLNISLAFYLVILWTPLVVLVHPTHNRLITWLQRILMAVVSPMGLLMLGCYGNALVLGKPLDDFLGEIEFAIASSVLEFAILGNWIFLWATLVVTPAWYCFWSVVWARPQS